jgi:hypothetical protein
MNTTQDQNQADKVRERLPERLRPVYDDMLGYLDCFKRDPRGWYDRLVRIEQFLRENGAA